MLLAAAHVDVHLRHSRRHRHLQRGLRKAVTASCCIPALFQKRQPTSGCGRSAVMQTSESRRERAEMHINRMSAGELFAYFGEGANCAGGDALFG